MEPEEQSAHQSRQKRYFDLLHIAWKSSDMSVRAEAVREMIALAKAEKSYSWLSETADWAGLPCETRQQAEAELRGIGPEWVPGEDTAYFCGSEMTREVECQLKAFYDFKVTRAMAYDERIEPKTRDTAIANLPIAAERHLSICDYVSASYLFRDLELPLGIIARDISK